MKHKSHLLVFLSLLLLLILSNPTFAQSAAPDNYDQAALLMLHSKNTMQGKDANELRQLAGYYEDYYNNAINNLQNSGKDPDGRLAAALQKERDEKVAPLQAQAKVLDAARQHRSRNNAVRKVARFFGRIIKGGGRALGFGVSKTMEGISKGAQIVVDEVAPKVIEGVLKHAKTTLLSGGSLEGSALRTLVRELFQRHAKQAIKARLLPKVARLAEKMLGEQAAQAVAVLASQGEYVQAGIDLAQPDTAPVPDVDDTPSQPDPATDPNDTPILELTPQEEANKGTHMYLVVCHGSEMACATRPTIEVELSIVFLEGAVKVNGNLRQKVGLNQYVWEEDYVLTFTMDGMTNVFPDGSSDVYSRKN